MAAGLKRIADSVSDAGSKIAKPADSEAAGIKATGDAENEYLNAVKSTMTPSAETPRSEGTSADHVNPMAKYGDRGSEERIDTSSMTKPLAGSTPVYDRGGVVGEQPREVIEDPQMDVNKFYQQQNHRMHPESHNEAPVQDAQNTPHTVINIGHSSDHRMNTPLYDEGGVVDKANVDDGQHQVAVLENGERVLTPEENAQYEAEHQQTVSPAANAQQSAKMKPMSGGEAQPPAKEAPKVGPPAVGQVESPEAIDQEAKGAKLRPISGEPTPDVMESGKPDPNTLGGNPAAPAPGTPVHPFGPQMTGVDEYHSHLRDLKNEMETGFQNKDYVKAGNAKLALNELEKANPYGSEYNHPGFAGKFLHGLSEVGQAAANTVVGPGLTAGIPGTQTHMNLEAKAGEQLAGEGVKRGLETEQTAVAHKAANAPDSPEQQLIDAQDQARANPTPENQKKVEDLQNVIDKGKTQGPDKLNQQLLDAEDKRDKFPQGSPEYAAADAEVGRIKDAIGAGKPATPNLEAHKQEQEKIVAKLAAAGLKTDPANLDKSIETGVAKNIITKDEGTGLQGYQAINPNAATQEQTHNQEGESALERNYRHADLLVQTPDGPQQMTGAEAASHGYTQFEKMSPADAKKNREAQANTYANVQAFNKYGQDFDANITDEDKRIMESIVQHGPDANKVSGLISSLPAVGPIAGAVNKWISGNIDQTAYENLTPEGKKILADYYTAVISNFSNMQTVLHSLPRNQAMIQAEMEAIPRPYLDKATATQKLDTKLDDIHSRSSSVPKISGQPWAWENYKAKTAPAATANKTAQAPPPNTHPVLGAKGEVIGYATPEQTKRNTYTPNQ